MRKLGTLTTLMLTIAFTGCGQSLNEPQPQIEPEDTTPVVDVVEEPVVEERVVQLIANAGEDRTLFEGDTLELDAAATLYDGDDELMFQWHQTKGPAVEMIDYTRQALSITAPLIDGDTEIEFSVTVGDGKIVDQSFVSIAVLNRPDPTAIAVSPMGHTFAFGDEVVLDASLSVSESGNELEYEWVQVAGPAVEIEDPNQPMIQFAAPAPEASASEILFDVVVKDGPVSTTAMLRLIVYSPDGAAPIPSSGSGSAGAGDVAAPPAPPAGGGGGGGGSTPSTPVNTDPGTIAGFTLINADTNAPISGFDPLESGAVLDLDDLPPLAIQAHAGSVAPVSMRIVLRQDGQVIANQVENQLPFALFGDDDSGFLPWNAVGPFSDSTYVLTATPFAEVGARGAIGSSLSVTFDTVGSVYPPTADDGGVTEDPGTPDDEQPVEDDPPVEDPQPECVADADCDDGEFCNGSEACVDGSCVAGDAPCTTPCDEGADACEVQSGLGECVTDGDCENGLFCSGARTCVDGACVNGASPCGMSEVCDEQADSCTVPGGNVYYVGPDIADDAAPQCTVDNPCATPQEAIDLAGPGDTIIIRGGTYTSNTSVRAANVMNIENGGLPGLPLTIMAAPGEHVTLSGNTGISDILVRIVAPYVNIEGFELTEARRIGIFISAPAHDINVRMCHAHHNNYDIGWIGAAFRTGGPVYNVLFEDCISNDNSGGFQLREAGTLTALDALTPPQPGNIGFPNGLAENQWDSWPGWSDYSASHVTMRRCMAYDNRLLAEHSDGIGIRYGDRCTVEDCILFRNTDDGMDVLGSTRCLIKGNLVFDNNPNNVLNGDGNGIKIGVRGGLDHIVHNNVCFENKRGGIDMADTERATVYNNTTVANREWFGLWFEAGVSVTGHTVFNNLSSYNPKADIGRAGHVIFATFSNNLMADTNSHNWAPDTDETSLVSVDPAFNDPDRAIDTNFPDDWSIPQKMQYVRDQVNEKLGLTADSPAANAGTVLPGLTADYQGSAPDMGALENN